MDDIAIRCSNYVKMTGLSVKNTNYKKMITTFLLNKVLHQVVMSWIIFKKIEYDIEEHNTGWIIYYPWYNRSIFTKLHGTVFGKYIINARTDRYNLVCTIDAH